MKTRCKWPGNDPLYIDYHDNEWGKPIYDNRLLFEFLILEGMQAGLSWITVLRKREHFRNAFDHFDPYLIANYQQSKIDELLMDSGIIRNRLKIHAAITNARAFVNLKGEGIDFASYLWGFVKDKPLLNHWKSQDQIPSKTELSDAMSKSLKQKGFKFVGSTICYAFMQATGMVNDHIITCFCYPDKNTSF